MSQKRTLSLSQRRAGSKSRPRKRVLSAGKALSLSRPLGTRIKTSHRYVGKDLTINPTISGLPVTLVFSANGMYDPDITGVGHQPSGFDQIGEFFGHYTVLSSKIKVTFKNTDGSNAQICSVNTQSGTSTIADMERIIENGAKYAVIDELGGGGETVKTLTAYCDVAKFMGRPSILSEDDLRGTVSANPVYGS